MKAPLLALLGLLQAASAHAYTKAEFNQSYGDLTEQAEKLMSLNPSSCPWEHKRLYSGKSLKVALYYGYEDFDAETIDGVNAAAMVKVLKQPCPPNLEVCGFAQVKKGAHFTTLRKSIRGRTVELSVYSTSVSNDNSANTDGHLRERQEARSEAVRASFHNDLVNSDVVFYHGHSRHGAGLGFDSIQMPRDIFNFVFRLPLQSMAQALRVQPSRLKVLGLFACESNDHYRSVVEQSNPRINLMVTKDDVNAGENEQNMLGSLNALLAQKCNAELQVSMISVSTPDHHAMEYVRRPE